MSKYIVWQQDASNLVSHLSRTITILSGLFESLNRSSSRFFCPLLNTSSSMAALSEAVPLITIRVAPSSGVQPISLPPSVSYY